MKILVIIDVPSVTDVDSPAAEQAIECLTGEMKQCTYSWHIEEVYGDDATA